MLDIRVRNRLPKEALDQLAGKVLSHDDYSILVTQNTRITGPEGQLLAVFIKNALNPELTDDAYKVLTTIRDVTDNRGFASGSKTVRVGRQTRAFKVRSSIIGAFEADHSRHPMCRLTAWTGRHVPEWELLRPYIRAISDVFREHVPDRWERQMAEAQRTHPAWVIPSTPYTTLTVNHTYATGVHVDDGDLAEGFTCLSAICKGAYDGGQLCLPEYQLAFDIGTGDVLLYNAHKDWHGNVSICDMRTWEEVTGPTDDIERISVVCYFRSGMTSCSDPATEANKAKQKWGAVPA